MKFQSRCLGISAAVLLLAQTASFVEGAPFFHSNSDDASLNGVDICKDLRITYPATQNLVLDDGSKHLVAWQAPSGLSQVEISLVSETAENNGISLGSHAANRGVTDEVAFDLHGQQPGTYRVHIHATGDQTCDVDSVPFTIQKRSEAQTTETSAPETQTQTQTQPPSQPPSHMDNEQLEALVQEIKPKTTKPSTQTHMNDAQLEQLVQEAKYKIARSSHVDDAKLEQIIVEAKAKSANGNENHTNDDPAWDRMMKGLDKTYTPPPMPVYNPPSEVPPDAKPSSKQKSEHLNEIANQKVKELQEHQPGKPTTHSNEDASPKTTPTFDAYIKSLDQDVRKFIANIMETENKAVTHNNDAEMGETSTTLNHHVDAELSQMLSNNDGSKPAWQSNNEEKLAKVYGAEDFIAS